MTGLRKTPGKENLLPSTETKQRVRARGNGEGLVRHHPKRDLWEVRLMVGVKPDGKPDIRSRYGKTRASALEKLDALRRSLQDGTLGDAKAERLTVTAFLEHWLAVSKDTIRASTWERYEEYVRLHLIPALGRHRISALRPDHLQQFYTAKRRAGLSPRTVHHLHAVLHRALHRAVQWGMAAHNVADAVDPPRVPTVELRPPTLEEMTRFLASAEQADDPLRALWSVAFYSGCRQGELLGLQWLDVDFDAGTLMVQRTLLGASDRVPAFGEPKTERSRRTVALPLDALVGLRQHRTRQLTERLAAGADYATYDLVFCSHIGTPLLARNVVRSFKAALTRAGLPERIRFHDLRHAAATTLRRAGVDLKTVSERLGHSTISITADLYTHAVSKLDADAADKLQAAMQVVQKEAAESN